ncbi:ABC transporter substrate-binding protein [Nocardiopsis changdeensis]|uniref:ABC transporter substrate-binding protein n=1 Tax=Nocardiopsis changdeensis TaxID=2831969 RepID=A0ABX8BHD4_9ACTN|nr:MULTISPECIES: ABC transporter substrate-binding protein [Nocardiopsis]QUX21630.1 ABC transporter substrate-binding protein [Nocardiopsis changdeensis]QYX37564.1 ABC transporter substrate-binding protein [Nocardiopsis sp. MT53]
MTLTPDRNTLLQDLSRRRLLKAVGFGAVGVAGANVLAACAGGDNASNAVAGQFTGVYDYDIDAQTRNVAVEDGALLMNSVYADLFLPAGGFYNWKTHEWDYLLMENAVWEGDDLIVSLRPGLKWSDGTDLNADDLHQNFAIRVLEAPAWSIGFPQITELEKLDDLSVRARFDNPFPGIELQVIDHRLFSKSTYGDFGERAIAMVADGVRQGDDEHNEFNAEFIAFNPTDVICSGPYKFDPAQTADARITLVRNEDGYQGTEVAFDEVVIHKGDNRQASLLIQQGEVDYSTLATSAADQQAFQSVEGLRWIEHPGYDGCGLMFNYQKKPELKDVRVRKALAHLLDSDQIGQVARGEAYTRVNYYAGLVDMQAEQVFSQEELAGFATYDLDHDKATELLEEAGWTKQDGIWHLPDGEPASFEVVGVVGWGDFELTATQVEEAWNDFGIQTTASNVPADNPWGIWAAGDFEVAVRHWGNPEIPSYWGAFQMNFLVENARTGDTPGQDFDLKVDSPSQGEVDLEALVEVAKTAPTEEEQIEAVRTMAIVFNELLPRIPVWTYKYLAPALEGVRVAKFDDDHPASQNQIYMDNHVILSLIQGDLKPVE